jgi:hypothetical protein
MRSKRGRVFQTEEARHRCLVRLGRRRILWVFRRSVVVRTILIVDLLFEVVLPRLIFLLLAVLTLRWQRRR